jgi:hypothetical protein
MALNPTYPTPQAGWFIMPICVNVHGYFRTDRKLYGYLGFSPMRVFVLTNYLEMDQRDWYEF